MPRRAKRIYNGQDAGYSEFPHMVAIFRRGSFTKPTILKCGGALIADRWVLSAAHCFRDLAPESIFVLAGGVDFSVEGRLHKRFVERIIEHPDFRQYQSTKNDIALIKLKDSFIPDRVATIPLPIMNEEEEEDSLAVMSGWGRYKLDSDLISGLPNRLQKTTMKILSDSTCRDLLKSMHRNENPIFKVIHDEQICIISPNFDNKSFACKFDSGSPIVSADSGKLVGIISWGNVCNSTAPRMPDVAVQVSKYVNWIHREIMLEGR